MFKIIKKQIKRIISSTINLEKVFAYHHVPYDEKEISAYLHKENILTKIKDSNLNKNESAIFYAALNNHVELFKNLLKYHIEIDMGEGMLLKECAIKGELAIVKHILKNNLGKLPIYLEETMAHYILINNDIDFLDFYFTYLEKNKSEFDMQYIKKDFLKIMYQGKLYDFKGSKTIWLDELIKRGIIFYIHDIKEMIYKNENEMISHLFNKIEHSESEEEDLIITAIKKNNINILKIIHESKKYKNILYKKEILVYAAETGNVEIVDFLLKNYPLDINLKAKSVFAESCNIYIINENIFSPVEAAMIANKKEVVNYLLEKGVSIDIERLVEMHIGRYKVISIEMFNLAIKWLHLRQLTKTLNEKELVNQPKRKMKM